MDLNTFFFCFWLFWSWKWHSALSQFFPQSGSFLTVWKVKTRCFSRTVPLEDLEVLEVNGWSKFQLPEELGGTFCSSMLYRSGVASIDTEGLLTTRREGHLSTHTFPLFFLLRLYKAGRVTLSEKSRVIGLPYLWTSACKPRLSLLSSFG